tara:strand:- start:26439 stop:28007 length:1569 start_codon:yes stop_codon:yes gene_type:complete
LEINRDKWQTEFEKNLDKAERKQISKVKRFYKKEYDKGIKSFVSQGQTSFKLLFDEKDLLKIYRDLYQETGLQFAKWYSGNFKKFIKKSFDKTQIDIWKNSFGSFGSAMGAQRVTLVKGTALKTLQRVTQQLMTDPEFMTMGSSQQARILRNQFALYSQQQAERLVRTETTAAANFAQKEAANTIFPGAQKDKVWIAAFDDRVRDSHAAADGQQVKENDLFIVGGQQMAFPGDPAGGAAEVINCRCSHYYVPRQDAQAAAGIDGFSLGLGGGSATGFGMIDAIGAAIGSTLVSSAQRIISDAAKTLKEAKSQLNDLFSQYGFNVDKITMSRSLTLAQYNERIQELKKLMSQYNFGTEANLKRAITILNKSTKSANGSVSSLRYNGDLTKINFGDEVNRWSSRNRIISTEEFVKRFGSAVDEANNHLSTMIHEMAHVMARSNDPRHREFFRKLSEIRVSYRADIAKYQQANNYKKYNEIYLGRYANHDIDEFLAEGWTEYRLSSNPSQYARLIGELIDQNFKF